LRQTFIKNITTMQTSLTIDFDMPSNCMYDLEAIRHKVEEYIKILIEPAARTFKDEDFEVAMLSEKSKNEFKEAVKKTL